MKKKNLIKGLILLAVILNLTTSFGQSVIINEIVTDPQQDWSSTSFTTPPGYSSGSNDEWIELYIRSASIDLTGWTIELIDGTNVSGNLELKKIMMESSNRHTLPQVFLNGEHIGDCM